MQSCTRWLLGVIALIGLGAGLAYWSLGPPPNNPSRPVVLPLLDSSVAVTGPPWFRDITRDSGIEFAYRSGADAGHLTILESIGGGCALFDYDGDGLLDIFLTGGGFFDKPRRDYPQDPDAYQLALKKSQPAIRGHPCKLYRNLGNFKFDDVTQSAGLERPWFYTHGVAVADYDRDGWPDLLVTGYGHVALFHNEPAGQGGRSFVEVSKQLGIVTDTWATSAAWGDLDGDGWPDLYLCHYCDWSFTNHPSCKGTAPGVPFDICSPGQFKPVMHALFRNEQGRSFSDVSRVHGFAAAGHGLGVVIADLNGDGRPDVYAANDTTDNFLYVNRGGKLQEKALVAGVAVDENGKANGSMGVAVGDYDGTGRPSLFVTNFQGELHALYRNLGKELFRHHTRAAGIGAIGQHYVGFGTAFVDVDRDGWEDLVIANGHVFLDPSENNNRKQRPVLLRNVSHQGGRFFRDVSAQGGPFFQRRALGRGLAVGDLDNDGRLDLLVTDNEGPAALLRNETAGADGWLGIRLLGRAGRDVVGSTVILECDGQRLTRFIKGGGSYMSAGDTRIVFGWGDAKPAALRVTVKWSWGQSETWDKLEANRYVELREGEGVAPAPKYDGFANYRGSRR